MAASCAAATVATKAAATAATPALRIKLFIVVSLFAVRWRVSPAWYIFISYIRLDLPLSLSRGLVVGGRVTEGESGRAGSASGASTS